MRLATKYFGFFILFVMPFALLHGQEAPADKGAQKTHVPQLLRELKAPKSGLTAVALSPDGKMAVLGGKDNMLLLWHPETGRQIKKIATPFNYIVDVEFVPGGRGKFAVTGTMKGGPGHLAYYTKFSSRPSGSFKTHYLNFSFSPTGKHYVTGGDYMNVYRATDGKKIASAGSGKPVVFAENDNTLVGWKAPRVTRWLIDRQRSSLKMENPRDRKRGMIGLSMCEAMAVCRPKNFVVIACVAKPTVKVLDLKTLAVKRELAPPATEHPLLGTKGFAALAVSADGKLILGGAYSGYACLWEVGTGRLLSEWKAHEGPIFRVFVSPKADWFVTARKNEELRVWAAPRGSTGK